MVDVMQQCYNTHLALVCVSGCLHRCEVDGDVSEDLSSVPVRIWVSVQL